MKIQTIVPNTNAGAHCMHRLFNLTAQDIQARLGFAANVKDDPSKVRYSWGFDVITEDGVTYTDLGIWDYKGSYLFQHFSAFGPLEVLEALFPGHVITA